MAASSSSGLGKTSKGSQVFLNFRGEELRKTFIADLEFALEEANINYFIDKHEQLGTKLQNLLVRIEQSRVALAIFSKEYTTSVWCLDELVKIRECMDKGSLIGIPIFYKLKTSVVSNLEGDFGDNFRKLKRNNQQDLVRTQNWEEALTSIPEIIGMHLSEYRFFVCPFSFS
ncbi:Protein PHLOEM PROTEIN 2-LIKE A8 [Cardamine amara subsp. amara]|uniref:Protein PHLOEM PROTEIN 2-LIKE A8 n=1 Tax=Cardamine amara subsp. amara TaxID=228776 RepID=A0ABD1C3A6_CARAN